MEERVSKLMARKGLCSRREAEQYIEEGRVRVNGVLVTDQGTKVPVHATITLDDKGLQKVTIALNKPLGFVSNLPQKNYREAKELILPENRFDKGDPIDPRSLHVVGRLDINSKGLLLFSSDGRVAKKIIGPDSNIEKEYVVRFCEPVPEKALHKLRFGLSLDGKRLKQASVKRAGDQTLIIVLREGKKRQIRRMCELVGLKVSSLKRVRIGNIQIGSLPVGQWMVVFPTLD
ncbi:MAG: rRNA pseudouridine synthase [Parachlamydiales bacterium]|nr:rRNA pseudouridine synthase [Parachlamydiales bacterium]